MQHLDAPKTADAEAFRGVKRATVIVCVPDKAFDLWLVLLARAWRMLKPVRFRGPFGFPSGHRINFGG